MDKNVEIRLASIAPTMPIAMTDHLIWWVSTPEHQRGGQNEGRRVLTTERFLNMKPISSGKRKASSETVTSE